MLSSSPKAESESSPWSKRGDIDTDYVFLVPLGGEACPFYALANDWERREETCFESSLKFRLRPSAPDVMCLTASTKL